MTHTLPDEIDPARWAERDLDAGTLIPFADRLTDDEFYEEELDDEPQ